MTSQHQPATLPRFGVPHDWPSIDEATATVGGAIVERLLPDDLVERLNAELDAHGRANPDEGLPDTGDAEADAFHGKRTIRLHALTEKLPSGAELIGHDPLVDWADRQMRAISAQTRLNAGESIEIGPGEPAQMLHRDSDAWPMVPPLAGPLVVNAIISLTPFTHANGATAVVPGSWRWPKQREPEPDQVTYAEMHPGDALLFRGDLIHGGGANSTTTPRRAISVSYCAGWLRPFEESLLNVPPDLARRHPKRVQSLLGYEAHDAIAFRGGTVGLFEGRDPSRALERARRS